MGLWSKLGEIDRRLGTKHNDVSPPVGLRLLQIVGLVALVMVPVMAVVGFQTIRSELRDSRARDLLARDGTLAEGTVIGVREPHRASVLPDAVRVEFVTTEERTIRTWMPVSDRPDEGARAQVRYSTSHPEVARLAGDETPYRGRWKIVAIGGTLFSIVMVLLWTASLRFQNRHDSRPAAS